jgi:hypothetical protein
MSESWEVKSVSHYSHELCDGNSFKAEAIRIGEEFNKINHRHSSHQYGIAGPFALLSQSHMLFANRLMLHNLKAVRFCNPDKSNLHRQADYIVCNFSR